MSEHLKLVAYDGEDLAVLSAHLELAQIWRVHMVHLPDERRFVFIARRFAWESPGIAKSVRPQTGVHIDHVFAVRHFEDFKGDQEFSLLSLQFVMKNNPAGDVVLNFGDKRLVLEVECLEAHLTDLEENARAQDAGAPPSLPRQWDKMDV